MVANTAESVGPGCVKNHIHTYPAVRLHLRLCASRAWARTGALEKWWWVLTARAMWGREGPRVRPSCPNNSKAKREEAIP
jgi:hypothetical protein